MSKYDTGQSSSKQQETEELGRADLSEQDNQSTDSCDTAPEFFEHGLFLNSAILGIKELRDGDNMTLLNDLIAEELDIDELKIEKEVKKKKQVVKEEDSDDISNDEIGNTTKMPKYETGQSSSKQQETEELGMADLSEQDDQSTDSYDSAPEFLEHGLFLNSSILGITELRDGDNMFLLNDLLAEELDIDELKVKKEVRKKKKKVVKEKDSDDISNDAVALKPTENDKAQCSFVKEEILVNQEVTEEMGIEVVSEILTYVKEEKLENDAVAEEITAEELPRQVNENLKEETEKQEEREEWVNNEVLDLLPEALAQIPEGGWYERLIIENDRRGPKITCWACFEKLKAKAPRKKTPGDPNCQHYKRRRFR